MRAAVKCKGQFREITYTKLVEPRIEEFGMLVFENIVDNRYTEFITEIELEGEVLEVKFIYKSMNIAIFRYEYTEKE